MLPLFPSRFPAGPIVRSGRVGEKLIMLRHKSHFTASINSQLTDQTFITYFLNDPNN